MQEGHALITNQAARRRGGGGDHSAPKPPCRPQLPTTKAGGQGPKWVAGQRVRAC